MLCCLDESLVTVHFQVLWTLHFTTLLIEHSFSRHLYSSMEHLSLLLSSFDLDVVLAVLNLLYMFSKRSNFISRLAPDKRQLLLTRLSHLAASWGGKDNGFGLSVCCRFDFFSKIIRDSFSIQRCPNLILPGICYHSPL